LRIYNLSKKAVEEFFSTLWELPMQADKGKNPPKLKDLKIAELDDPELAVIFENELKLYVGRKGKELYFPLLKDEVILPKLASGTVDMGAVKFVCNGAKVMRPGIVSFTGDFRKGDLLVVKEVSHSKAIAIGRALSDKGEMEAMKTGPAIENLHYVSDKFWDALKLLEAHE
jgi:PUA domain protein